MCETAGLEEHLTTCPNPIKMALLACGEQSLCEHLEDDILTLLKLVAEQEKKLWEREYYK